MTNERTVEDAVDVYLERLDRLIQQGHDLPTAKAAAMVVALVWLGVENVREHFQPKLEDALGKRRAAVMVKKRSRQRNSRADLKAGLTRSCRRFGVR